MLEVAIAVSIVILGAAICSITETALLSVSKIRVRQMAQSKTTAALTLLNIREKINRPIATIVIINNLFSIVGSIVIGRLATEVLGDAGLGIFSGILTFVIIVFGEIIPKTFGERYAENISLIVALPVQFFTILFTPIVWIMEKITAPFVRREKTSTTNETEIRLLTWIGRQEGVIDTNEAKMIQRVFQLNDLNAEDLMTPRIVVTYLRGDLTLAQAKEDIVRSQHSRILIVKDSIDNPIGLALRYELLVGMIEGKNNEKLTNFSRPIRSVPETEKADKLLKIFQENREHLAVVLDESGKVTGVVTLEDVLEVVTGEIVDETDRTVDLREIARKKQKKSLLSRELNLAK